MKMTDRNNWQPPEFVSRDRCIKDTEEIFGKPELQLKQTEDIFRIDVLGMEWDLGMMVYEPDNASKIPTGADGKKAGFSCSTAVREISEASNATPSSSPTSLDSKLSPGLFPEDSIFPIRAEIGPTIRFTPMAPYARRSGNAAN